MRGPARRAARLAVLVPPLLAGLVVLAVRAEEGEPAGPPSVRRAIARAAPSVVLVEVDGERPRGDAPRRRFFRPVAGRDAGAGVVVGEHLVLTHAALALYEDPSFRVTTASGARHPARLAALDLERELAVLRVEGALDAPAAALGASDGLRVGNLVVALGDPFEEARDAQPAATLGVVEGRLALESRAASYAGEVLLTDAAINPGSEGGPLVDLEGRVVGVLAPLVRDRRTGGLHGHAVPIEAARPLLAEAEGGARRGPKLGFLGRAGRGGVVVAVVRAGGPAERAGLRAGDVILAVAGRRVRSSADLRRAIGAWEPEGPLRLEVERDGERRVLDVDVGGGRGDQPPGREEGPR